MLTSRYVPVNVIIPTTVKIAMLRRVGDWWAVFLIYWLTNSSFSLSVKSLAPVTLRSTSIAVSLARELVKMDVTKPISRLSTVVALYCDAFIFIDTEGSQVDVNRHVSVTCAIRVEIR